MSYTSPPDRCAFAPLNATQRLRSRLSRSNGSKPRVQLPSGFGALRWRCARSVSQDARSKDSARCGHGLGYPGKPCASRSLEQRSIPARPPWCQACIHDEWGVTQTPLWQHTWPALEAYQAACSQPIISVRPPVAFCLPGTGKEAAASATRAAVASRSAPASASCRRWQAKTTPFPAVFPAWSAPMGRPASAGAASAPQVICRWSPSASTSFAPNCRRSL